MALNASVLLTVREHAASVCVLGAMGPHASVFQSNADVHKRAVSDHSRLTRQNTELPL